MALQNLRFIFALEYTRITYNITFNNYHCQDLSKVFTLYHHVHIRAGLQFTLLPGNVTISLNQAQDVTFTCSLSDSSSFRTSWVVKFPDIMQNLSTRDINDMVILDDRGVLYDSSSVTIPGILRNNDTTIRCAALVSSTTTFSDPVKLTVAGKLPITVVILMIILLHVRINLQ